MILFRAIIGSRATYQANDVFAEAFRDAKRSPAPEWQETSALKGSVCRN